jgi:hypothetical protein
MNNQEEIWIELVDEPAIYISNFGRFKSVKIKTTILKTRINTNGYHYICDNVETRLYTHLTVAKYFLKNPKNRKLVRHINKDLNDNRASNLLYYDIDLNIFNLKNKFEKYKPIERFPNYYISNYGNIKSIRYGNEEFIKPFKDKDGYDRINIYDENKEPFKFRIHRLIALAFIKNPHNKPIVDHINRDNTCNHWINLRWLTSMENKWNTTKLSNRNSSGYLGVSFNNQTQKYISAIYYNGKTKYLGYFDTAEEASQVYQEAKALYQKIE